MDWTALISQLPALAAFIWFTLEQQKRYQQSMDRRDEAYLAAINRITDKLDTHDDHVQQRIDAAIEAGRLAGNPRNTQPRKRAGSGD